MERLTDEEAQVLIKILHGAKPNNANKVLQEIEQSEFDENGDVCISDGLLLFSYEDVTGPWYLTPRGRRLLDEYLNRDTVQTTIEK